MYIYHMHIQSRLPNVGTIFIVMSAPARGHNAINLSQGFPAFGHAPQITGRSSGLLSHKISITDPEKEISARVYIARSFLFPFIHISKI